MKLGPWPTTINIEFLHVHTKIILCVRAGVHLFHDSRCLCAKQVMAMILPDRLVNLVIQEITCTMQVQWTMCLL